MTNKKVKKTLLLDEWTVRKLKEYGTSTSGSENLSNGVRSMVREFYKVRREYNING